MLNAVDFFDKLTKDIKQGIPRSICSICSSNKLVIEAAFEEGMRRNEPVLIEATANQTNQFGGYTGMQPADFVDYVCKIADSIGFDRDMLILGGDHLGPLVWSGESENSSMKKAEDLVAAFASCGFAKIHLDCSMRLVDDDPNVALAVETVASRAAQLADVVEKNAKVKPVYIIGSEVPIPGGATEAEDSLSVTRPVDLIKEYDAFRDAFIKRGLADAWERVVGIVVQPGVEFGDDQVFMYDRSNASELMATAMKLPHIILEGHSTDYQPEACLKAMREDGIGVLKVGPALTFAAREAIFALEKIEREVINSEPDGGYSRFQQTLEQAMLDSPANWIKHYHGNEESLRLMRGYSLSDRSRYYMEIPTVKQSLTRLIQNINSIDIPIGILHQYLPTQADEIIAQQLKCTAESLIKENICLCLRSYG